MVKCPVKQSVILSVITSAENHLKKYGFKKMTPSELDSLCGCTPPHAATCKLISKSK